MDRIGKTARRLRPGIAAGWKRPGRELDLRVLRDVQRQEREQWRMERIRRERPAGPVSA